MCTHRKWLIKSYLLDGIYQPYLLVCRSGCGKQQRYQGIPIEQWQAQWQRDGYRT